MASEPGKVRQHRERERVLALGRLFEADPENPGRIAPAALALPLPDGVTARVRVADELMKFLSSPFADVRRLAASALGKMAPEKPPAVHFLTRLADLARNDSHPQVRQYAAKAIGKYPDEAFVVINDLRDVARDETAPKYVRTAAADAVAAIQDAVRKPRMDGWECVRCHRCVTVVEYRRSMERFGRTYCRHCQDEKEMESVDFESTVEAAKRRRTEGGTAVQSQGEKRIAEFLESEGIAFVYDARYRVTGADLIRPDFYLPEFDVYIEYFGMNTPKYNEKRRRKEILYQRTGKRLISVSFRDDADLVGTLKAKLSRYIRLGGDAGASPDANGRANQ